MLIGSIIKILNFGKNSKIFSILSQSVSLPRDLPPFRAAFVSFLVLVLVMTLVFVQFFSFLVVLVLVLVCVLVKVSVSTLSNVLM